MAQEGIIPLFQYCASQKALDFRSDLLILFKFKPCPYGQAGDAVWMCGFDGQWIDFPDMSNCSKIDTAKSIDELNDSNSVPSDVIAKLYQNVSKEAELGAGDISNIIDVLNVALDVQYDRLQSAENPTDYADRYTSESVSMMSDILARPDSWFGIPPR